MQLRAAGAIGQLIEVGRQVRPAAALNGDGPAHGELAVIPDKARRFPERAQHGHGARSGRQADRSARAQLQGAFRRAAQGEGEAGIDIFEAGMDPGVERRTMGAEPAAEGQHAGDPVAPAGRHMDRPGRAAPVEAGRAIGLQPGIAGQHQVRGAFQYAVQRGGVRGEAQLAFQCASPGTREVDFQVEHPGGQVRRADTVGRQVRDQAGEDLDRLEGTARRFEHEVDVAGGGCRRDAIAGHVQLARGQPVAQEVHLRLVGRQQFRAQQHRARGKGAEGPVGDFQVGHARRLAILDLHVQQGAAELEVAILGGKLDMELGGGIRPAIEVQLERAGQRAGRRVEKHRPIAGRHVRPVCRRCAPAAFKQGLQAIQIDAFAIKACPNLGRLQIGPGQARRKQARPVHRQGEPLCRDRRVATCGCDRQCRQLSAAEPDLLQFETAR